MIPHLLLPLRRATVAVPRRAHLGNVRRGRAAGSRPAARPRPARRLGVAPLEFDRLTTGSTTVCGPERATRAPRPPRRRRRRRRVRRSLASDDEPWGLGDISHAAPSPSFVSPLLPRAFALSRALGSRKRGGSAAARSEFGCCFFRARPPTRAAHAAPAAGGHRLGVLLGPLWLVGVSSSCPPLIGSWSCCRGVAVLIARTVLLKNF